MKPNPAPITDRDAERSITVTLGVFVVAFAAVLALLPTN